MMKLQQLFIQENNMPAADFCVVLGENRYILVILLWMFTTKYEYDLSLLRAFIPKKETK